MNLREVRTWLNQLEPDDHVDIISGNTLTASRNGKIIDSLCVGGTSFADYRKQCYKEFKAGTKPLSDFFTLGPAG